jgi:MurNAc alpha-1-phosphate uridylyltransferase
MHAMILAAGRGERLRPLTDNTPKPLLQAGPHRLIEYHLYALARAGIREIIINVAHLGQQIIDTLGDGSRYKVHIQYSDETGHVLETGGGIYNALPLLQSDPFLVINGDIWTDMDLRRLPDRIDREAHLVLVKNPPHNKAGDFCLHHGCVADMDADSQSWTFSGMGLYSHRFFAGCQAGRFALGGLLRSKFSRCGVTGEVYTGEWLDIGTRERLNLLAERLAGERANP